MATRSLLTQNDNTVLDYLRPKVGKTYFPNSNTNVFPMKIGKIYPFFLRPCAPSESLEIGVTALVKQLSPLSVSLMANFKLNTAFYYIDYRLCWHKFERFMTGGKSGDELYDIPLLGDGTGNLASVDSNITESLRSYMNITTHAISKAADLPEAAAFYGYQLVCRDFYTNEDRLEDTSTDPTEDWTYENLFPADPFDFQLQDGQQEEVNGVVLDKFRWHEVREDYFTASKPRPMRGAEPSIAISDVNASLDASDAVLSADSENGYHQLVQVFQQQTGSTTYDSHLVAAASGITPSSPTSVVSQDNSRRQIALKEAIEKIKVVGYTAANVTVRQIRWLEQVSVFKEANMIAKPYYSSWLKAHFNGVNVGEAAIERPIYIGGTSQDIVLSDVVQTTPTSDSPLGNIGQTAHSLANNYVGKMYCNNHGFILGVAYIIPDFIYEPAMPRWLNRRMNTDFLTPEFANLSMQAILNKEFFYSDDNDWNGEVLGYTGMYDEYRSYPNYAAGELLDDNQEDISKMVLLRRFDNNNKPEITHKFLSLEDNFDYSAWAAGDTVAPFIVNFASMVGDVLPLPRVAIPKLK